MTKFDAEQLKRMADLHWEYTQSVGEFHYKSAMIHGYGHGYEHGQKDGYEEGYKKGVADGQASCTFLEK